MDGLGPGLYIIVWPLVAAVHDTYLTLSYVHVLRNRSEKRVAFDPKLELINATISCII